MAARRSAPDPWRAVFGRGKPATAAFLVVATTVIPVLVTLFVRANFIQAFRVPSASMAPALVPGDHVMVTKPGERRPPAGTSSRSNIEAIPESNI